GRGHPRHRQGNAAHPWPRRPGHPAGDLAAHEPADTQLPASRLRELRALGADRAERPLRPPSDRFPERTGVRPMDRLPARAQEPVSLTDSFTEELRRSILTGAKAPDERLHLETLKNEFEVSVGTVREGIARLVAEGLLVPNGRRG